MERADGLRRYFRSSLHQRVRSFVLPLKAYCILLVDTAKDLDAVFKSSPVLHKTLTDAFTLCDRAVMNISDMRKAGVTPRPHQ
jgi:hypothetical protein